MSIEAMKQALQALESSRVFVTTREKIKHPEGTEWYDDRITVLRQAIEAAEKQEPVTLQVNGIPPFKNPPVDVIDAAYHVSDWARSNNWVKWRIGDCCSVDFTTTPKREWVGLTEQEAMETWEGIIKYAPSEMRIKDFAKAVEAKLREKNG